jgi:hypothetical protein
MERQSDRLPVHALFSEQGVDSIERIGNKVQQLALATRI